MRSWLPWNLDRIFSLVVEEAASNPAWSVEPLHEEGNMGRMGGMARDFWSLKAHK